MSEGLNRVMLLGNLTADPELRFTQGGQAVLNIRLATNETYFDKDKQKKERVDYHQIVVWGPRGEALGKFLKKGSGIFVEGRLQTSSYEDRDGNKKWKTEVVANNVILTGGKPGGAADDDNAPRGNGGGRQASGGGGGGYGGASRSAGGGYGGGGGRAPAPVDESGGAFGSGPGGNDDDIPFSTCSMLYDLKRTGLL